MMENKIKKTLEFYSTKLKRKLNLIQPYRNTLNNGEQLDELDYARFIKLEGEIALLNQFIEDLEYFLEN